VRGFLLYPFPPPAYATVFPGVNPTFRARGLISRPILFERFDELRRARDQKDRRITAYVASLDEVARDGVITYRRVSSPKERRRRPRTGSITRRIIARRSIQCSPALLARHRT
jgi:hypothetical protein